MVVSYPSAIDSYLSLIQFVQKPLIVLTYSNIHLFEIPLGRAHKQMSIARQFRVKRVSYKQNSALYACDLHKSTLIIA